MPFNNALVSNHIYMMDRIRTPSPHRPRTLEKGAFSSLSTFSLVKPVDRKPASTLSSKSKPKEISTPTKNSRLGAPKKLEPDEEQRRQQETIRKLSSQLAKERKQNHVLETQLKQFRNSELKPLALSIERANKTIEALRTSQRTLVLEKEELTATLAQQKSQTTAFQQHLEGFAELLVDVVENIVQPLLDSDPQEEVIANVQKACLRQLTEASKATATDFSIYIRKAKAWTLDLPTPQVTPLVTRGQEVSFAAEKATALYAFAGERAGDLAFAPGDEIEVMEKHESGWWVGRCDSQIGVFPYNFVQLT